LQNLRHAPGPPIVQGDEVEEFWAVKDFGFKRSGEKSYVVDNPRSIMSFCLGRE